MAKDISNLLEKRAVAANDRLERVIQVYSLVALQTSRAGSQGRVFAILIHTDHCHYRQFRWRVGTHQFSCLPLDLSSAPRMFTKTMQGGLRQLGCRMITYINNNLLRATLKEEARLQVDLAIKVLEALEFVISHLKLTLEPCQEIQFLSFAINSTKITISIPPGKMRNVSTCMTPRAGIQHLWLRNSQFRREGIINGPRNTSHAAVLPRTPKSKQFSRPRPQGVWTLLRHWTLLWRRSCCVWPDQAHHWNGWSLKLPERSLWIQTEMSQRGWGAHYQGIRMGAPLHLKKSFT